MNEKKKKEKGEWTVWTKPMSDWNRVLDKVAITPAIREAIGRRLSTFDDASFAQRTKAFSTEVAAETYSKLVD